MISNNFRWRRRNLRKHRSIIRKPHSFVRPPTAVDPTATKKLMWKSLESLQRAYLWRRWPTQLISRWEITMNYALMRWQFARWSFNVFLWSRIIGLENFVPPADSLSDSNSRWENEDLTELHEGWMPSSVFVCVQNRSVMVLAEPVGSLKWRPDIRKIVDKRVKLGYSERRVLWQIHQKRRHDFDELQLESSSGRWFTLLHFQRRFSNGFSL